MMVIAPATTPPRAEKPRPLRPLENSEAMPAPTAAPTAKRPIRVATTVSSLDSASRTNNGTATVTSEPTVQYHATPSTGRMTPRELKA